MLSPPWRRCIFISSPRRPRGSSRGRACAALPFVIAAPDRGGDFHPFGLPRLGGCACARVEELLAIIGFCWLVFGNHCMRELIPIFLPSEWYVSFFLSFFLILAKAVLTQSRWGEIRARLLSTSLVLSLKVSSRDAGAVTQPRHAQNNCPVHWQSANRVVSCTNNLISYDIFSCTRVKVHPVFSGVPFFCASYFFHLHYLIYADSVVKPSHSEDIREEAACRASGPRNKREPHCE